MSKKSSAMEKASLMMQIEHPEQMAFDMEENYEEGFEQYQDDSLPQWSQQDQQGNIIKLGHDKFTLNDKIRKRFTRKNLEYKLSK